MVVFCCALEWISYWEGGPTGGQCSVAHWKECLNERGYLPETILLLTRKNVWPRGRWTYRRTVLVRTGRNVWPRVGPLPVTVLLRTGRNVWEREPPGGQCSVLRTGRNVWPRVGGTCRMAMFCCALEGTSDREGDLPEGIVLLCTGRKVWPRGGTTGGQCSAAHWKEVWPRGGGGYRMTVLVRTRRTVWPGRGTYQIAVFWCA
jgi:hypothetical protein